MADREFSIVSPSGVTIPLAVDDPAAPYALMLGTTGLGVPPVVNRFVDSAGNGGTNRGKRYGMRPMDLPIFISGENRADMEAKLRALDAVVDPEEPGFSKVVATYADGTQWELPFSYVSGLEGDGSVSTTRKTEVPLSVMCPQPFWVSTVPVQFAVLASSSTDGLLPDLAALKTSPSDAVGTRAVFNPGDVAAPITWIITGPGGPASATLNGQGWTVESVLAGTANTITITKTDVGVSVVDETGANRYSDLGSAPKFFDAPAGTFEVDLELEDATTGSRIAGSFRPRRKRIY